MSFSLFSKTPPARSAQQSAHMGENTAATALPCIALVANPFAACAGIAMERLCAALNHGGRHVLVVDAASTSPPAARPPRGQPLPRAELLSPQLSYLAARGLVLGKRGERGDLGSPGGLAATAPQADVLLLHADAADVLQYFEGERTRPVLLATDDMDSIKHAYAGLKLMAQHSGWMRCDLLLVAAPHSRRLPHIYTSLTRCAQTFLGASVANWAAVDPGGHASQAPDAALLHLVDGQCDRLSGLQPQAVLSRRLPAVTATATATATATSPLQPLHPFVALTSPAGA